MASIIRSHCVVCFNEYSNPVSLSCTHALCLSCARLMAAHAHAQTATAAQLHRQQQHEQQQQQKVDKDGVVMNDKLDDIKSKDGWNTFACPVCGQPTQYDFIYPSLGLIGVANAASIAHVDVPLPNPTACDGKTATALIEQLNAGVESCERHSGVLSNAHTTLAHAAQQLFDERNATRAKIDVYFDGLIARLQTVRQEKLNEVDAVYGTQHAVYESQIGVLGSALVFVRETINTARRVMQQPAVGDFIARAVNVVKRLEDACKLCRGEIQSPVFRTRIRMSGFDCADDVVTKVALRAESYVEHVTFAWDAATVNKETINVSADGSTVKHIGRSGSIYVLGPRLPNFGRHTWRLKVTGGGGDDTPCDMVGVSREHGGVARNSFGWTLDGLFCSGDGSFHDNFGRFSSYCHHQTPEVELTLDSDQHTLTMRRLDNGQTRTINNIPQNVFVYAWMSHRGNAVQFV